MRRAAGWLRSHPFTALGICLATAAFAWNAVDAIGARFVSIDEGVQLEAARAVMRGGVPLHDFAYGPEVLFPYLSGPVLGAVGFGVLELRSLCVALAALGLISVCAAFARRSARAEVGVVAAFSIAASPHWVNAVATNGPVAASTLWVAVAAIAFLWKGRLLARLAVFSVASALTAACEPVAALALLPFAVSLSLEARGGPRRAAAFAVSIAVPWAGLGAFLAGAAPEGAIADLWQVLVAAETPQPWRMSLAKTFSVSPGAFLASLASLAALPALIGKGDFAPVACLAAGALGLALSFPPAAESFVLTASIFPLLAGAGLMAAWSVARGEGSPLRHVLWVVPLMALYVPISEPPASLPRAEIDAAAAFIRKSVPPGQILTPFPAISVAADRRGARGAELGANGVLLPGLEKEAARLHMTTPAALAKSAEARRPAAMVLHRVDQVVDFGLDRRTGEPIVSGSVQRFQRAVAERYERAFTTDNLAVYVRREEKREGEGDDEKQ